MHNPLDHYSGYALDRRDFLKAAGAHAAAGARNKAICLIVFPLGPACSAAG